MRKKELYNHVLNCLGLEKSIYIPTDQLLCIMPTDQSCIKWTMRFSNLTFISLYKIAC